MSVCDAYNAMTTDRSYRRALPVADAIAELQRCAGTQFDPAVVAAVVAVVAEPAQPAWELTLGAESRGGRAAACAGPPRGLSPALSRVERQRRRVGERVGRRRQRRTPPPAGPPPDVDVSR